MSYCHRAKKPDYPLPRWIAALALTALTTAGCDKGSTTANQPSAAASPAVSTSAAPAAEVPTVSGFQTPESVLYDQDNDVYLISNINGSPLAIDGNGFISRVKPDRTVEALKWIDGAKDGITLNAPKGMTLTGGILYVADITHVRKFDQQTGEPKGEIEIPGATFVNDLATGPDGQIYVSDTGMKAGAEGFEPSGSEAVYRLVDGQPVALAQGEQLGKPNGLYVNDQGLWVVTFGTNELYRLDDKGQKVDTHKLPQGSLDGLVGLPDGTLLISSWAAKAVYQGPASGPFKEIISGVNAPADIGFDTKRRRILIPLFNDNQVQLRELPK